MPPLPEAIVLRLAPVAPRVSARLWGHAPVFLLGALLTPRARTVTPALRAMGLAMEHRFTNAPRGLNRATGSARQGSRRLLGWLLRRLVPPGAALVLGADATGERRSGRQIRAKGCSRDAVRSTKKHRIRGFGLQWVSMLRSVPVPGSRRGWALPCLTARCPPVEPAQRQRHRSRVDWGRQMREQGRRWRPGRRLVRVVDGGFAAVALALAWVKRTVVMGSRWRGDAALDHPPGPQPQGKRGRKPTQGKRQRRLQGWAARSDTPWATVEVPWSGGERQQLWGFSRTALWYTPGGPPVELRSGLVADPEGKWRLEAFCCTDGQATPEQILAWVVLRGSVEVTCAESRAPLGLETQRQGSAKALARTTPVLLALCSRVTVRALPLSQDWEIPVPATAWYRTREATFSAGLALVRQHLWRARSVVHSRSEAELRQCPGEALDLLIQGCPVAA